MTQTRIFCKPLFVTVLLCGAIFPNLGFAASTEADVRVGAQILRSELPPGTELERADCALLSRSLHHASLTHRAAATPIFVAALTGGKEVAKNKATLPCGCVCALFRAAVTAVPEKAVALLEQAVILYPDCGGELSQMVERLEGKDVVVPDGKDGLAPGSDRDPRSAGRSAGTDSFGNPATLDGGDPATATAPGIDPNAPGGVAANGTNAAVPGVGGASIPTPDGFGAGFGPGFPGSPGFSGSAPGGSFAALPTPTAPVVTPATNK